MKLLDLAIQVRLTHRVTISPTAASQFASLRHAQDHVRSGVLFGRWPAGYKTLSVEAAPPGGSLEWRKSEQDSAHPFTIQPGYIEGCHDMLCAPPGFWVQRVGYWAVLPPVPIHQPHRPVLNAILTQSYNQEFLKIVGDEDWLPGPQVVVIVREHAGHTDGHAYVFDPNEQHRLLDIDKRSSWPSRRPLPLAPALLWPADGEDRFWPA